MLLPGLDGTGRLFTPLIAALAGAFECRVLPLPTEGAQDQVLLAERLLPDLPSQPFVLLAESFSGAIAVEIAKRQPENLRQLILVASFLETPRSILKYMPFALIWLGWRFHRLLAPVWWPLCGKRDDLRMRSEVLAALRLLTWPILHARLRAITSLRMETVTLSFPVMVFHAASDRLLSRACRSSLDRLGSSQVVPGPHFLLQSEPSAMASALRLCIGK